MSEKLDTVGYGVESEAVYKGEHLCLPEITPEEAEKLRKELDEKARRMQKGKRAVVTKVRKNIAPNRREEYLRLQEAMRKTMAPDER